MQGNEVFYLTGQVLGFIAVVLSFVLYQLRTQKSLLFMQTVICAVIGIVRYRKKD